MEDGKKKKINIFARSVDMTEGVIWKVLLLYALPLILGDFLQEFYSTFDSIIVGRFVNHQALAAVTSTETLIHAIIGLFSGIAMGATVVIARFFGAKDDELISDSVQTVMTIAAVMGLIMTLVGIVFSPALLKVFNTPSDVMESAVSYLRIYFSGMMGLVIYNMASGIHRAVGDSVRPLIALAITAFINIALDIVFVVVFHWGVKGAAFATIIAIYASAAYMLWLLLTTSESHKLILNKWKFDSSTAVKVFAVGVPVGVQKSVINLSNLLVVAHINAFGSGASAGWGIYRKIDQLLANLNNNMAMAIAAFISQNLGAKKYERIKQGTRFGMIFMILVVGIMVDMLVYAFRLPIIKLFTDDSETIGYAMTVFSNLIILQPLTTVFNAFLGKRRGYGDTAGPMVITLIALVVLRQIFLNIMWSVSAIFLVVIMSYPVGWFFDSLFQGIYDAVQSKKQKYI